MLAELLQAADVAETRVAALLVGHVQPADRQRLHQAAGERGFLDQDEDVQVVAVFGQRVRDEAVVGNYGTSNRPSVILNGTDQEVAALAAN